MLPGASSLHHVASPHSRQNSDPFVVGQQPSPFYYPYMGTSLDSLRKADWSYDMSFKFKRSNLLILTIRQHVELYILTEIIAICWEDPKDLYSP